MNRHDETVQPLTIRTKWRDDFPIDRPLSHYVSRREFTKFLVLISGAFALGQAWIGLLNLQRKRQKAPVFRIATVSDIAIGDSLAFRYPNEHERCLLIRTGENDFVAYNDKCTHLMCPVIPQVNESRLYCPCHQGFFDLQSGRPIAGPPQRPLARIKLKIENGAIYATGVEVAKR